MNTIRTIFPNCLAALGCVTLMMSCESFLAVDLPASKIPNNSVFSDDASATSAVTGMYIDLYDGLSFAGGGMQSISALAGLSSDEFVNVPRQDRLYLDFEENNIDPLNENVLNIWSSLYKSVYSANSILEGVSASTGISEPTKRQLSGEAFLIRGFCYFYLTNLFGEIPIILGTDYNMNARLNRSPISNVYTQITKDLDNAEDLLGVEYLTGERTRVNKFAATALLSRVYLYTKDWARAEEKATNVIDQSGLYSLALANNVFLANSSEAVWQLRPLTGIDAITNEALIFGISNALSLNILSIEILKAFEPDDQRRQDWLVGYAGDSGTIYLPNKYKRFRTGSTQPQEYSMVIRLAEIYLIRAEARTMLDRLPSAISDLDRIRNRAGLPNTDLGISPSDLLLSIERERRIELLTEWGHRWFDLKRWNKASSALAQLKPNWIDSDTLYPIPAKEISRNSLLNPQNAGY